MFNQRWLLESIEMNTDTGKAVRYVGGMAQNSYLGQMLADILERTVEIPRFPQFCGATGGAITAAVESGLWHSFE